MTNDERLKTTIEVDTSSAQTNLSSLNRELKVMKSDFEATSAEMKTTGSESDKLKLKQKYLQDTIEAHKQKLALLNDKYAEAVEKYGESSSAAQNLKNAINKERTALANCQSELEGVNTDLNTMSEKEAESADKTAKLKEGVETLKTALSTGLKVAAEATAAAVAAVTAAMTEGIKTAYEWATAAGTYADDVLTESVVTGIDAETLQKWSYASQFIDTEVSVIENAYKRATMAAGNAAAGTQSAIDKFEAIGVAYVDEAGNIRDVDDIFWESIEALGQIENETERDAYAMDLFGKSAQELNPLIEAGREAFEAYGEEAANMGIVMSDDALTTAGGFNDAQNSMNSALTGLQNNIGVIAGTLFQPLVENATDAMSEVNVALADGFQAEEDGEAISNALMDLVNSSMDDILAILEAIKPVLKTLLDAVINAIVELLPEVLPTLITAAVDAIALLAESLPEIITAIMDAILAIDWIETGKTIIQGLVDGLLVAVEALWKSLTGVWNKIWESVTDFFGIHSPSTLAADAGGNILSGLVNGLVDGVADAIVSVVEAVGRIWNAIKEAFGLGGDSEEKTESEQAGTDIAEGMASGVTDSTGTVSDAIHHLGQAAIDVLKEDWGMYTGKESSLAKTYGGWFVKGISNGIGEANAESFSSNVLTMVTAIKNAFYSAIGVSEGGLFGIGANNEASEFFGIGKMISEGIAKGITDNTSVITVAATEAAQAAIKAAQKALDINSPSKVMRDFIGFNFDQGFAEGITNAAGDVYDAANNVAAGAAVAGSTAVDNRAYNTTSTVNVNAQVSNDIDIQKLAIKLAERNKRLLRGLGQGA